jgi:hypothetical protein
MLRTVKLSNLHSKIKNMKKLLGIVVIEFYRILEMKLEMDEIKQGLK